MNGKGGCGYVIRLDIVHAKINFDLLAWLECGEAYSVQEEDEKHISHKQGK